MSKKSTISFGSALKMKPREPGATEYPLSPASLARCGGIWLDMRNSMRAYSSTSPVMAAGKDHLAPSLGGDVQVEQQRLSVAGVQLAQRLGDLLGVAVGRLAVGDVEDRRRVAIGVGVAPVGQ